LTLGNAFAPINCKALRHADLFTEIFDFSSWGVESRTFVYNNPETLLGNWSYTFGFCGKLNAYMGNIKTKPAHELMGWFYGGYDHLKVQNVIINNTNPIALEFTQFSTLGDIGAPCNVSKPRTAKINIYCGRKGAHPNCTIAGGSASCLPETGDPTKNFCVCSAHYPYGTNPCSGLEINVLSLVCPRPISPPDVPHDVPVGAVFGIVLLVVFLIFVVVFVGGYIYNKSVLGLSGSDAVPLSSLCGGDAKEEYDIIEKNETKQYGSI